MKLLNIGFGNMVSGDRIIAIVSPDSAPIKRIVQDAKEQGMLIDATYGRSSSWTATMSSCPRRTPKAWATGRLWRR